MKQKNWIIALLIVAFVSCKNETKQSNSDEDTNSQNTETVSKLEDYQVVNLDLRTASEDGTSNNVNFTNEGAEFDGENSYVNIANDELDLKDGVSISTVFKFAKTTGAAPLTLFTFAGDSTEVGDSPLTFYISNRRITGVVSGLNLWGNDYGYENGMSSAFFDSPMLQPDKYYSLTVNIEEDRISLFVNGENYQNFENFSIKSLAGTTFVVGAFKNGTANSSKRNFIGTIKNIEVYNRVHNATEVTDYYLMFKEDIDSHNAVVDMEAMEDTTDNE